MSPIVPTIPVFPHIAHPRLFNIMCFLDFSDPEVSGTVRIGTCDDGLEVAVWRFMPPFAPGDYDKRNDYNKRNDYKNTKSPVLYSKAKILRNVSLRRKIAI
jgi:hypothetical protein